MPCWTTLDNLVDRIIKTVQGELILKANHVIWKKKAAGRGELHITAKNRRLAIERLELGLPGGKISMRNAIWPDGGGLGSSLDLEIRNFSYGFLTREKPKGPMRSQGVLSMRLSLISQAPKASDLLGRADGVFQVGLWPKDLETASFDLWAANLLFALLDSLAAKTGSHVNCAVGNFVMEKGLMTSKELIIDTSKVRVSGEAKLNFAKRTITVKLQPRAKQPQFFNLETPIHISGTFEQGFGRGEPRRAGGLGYQFRHQPGVRPPAPPVRRHPARSGQGRLPQPPNLASGGGKKPGKRVASSCLCVLIPHFWLIIAPDAFSLFAPAARSR